MEIRFISGFFGLGIAGEKSNVCDYTPDGMESWKKIHIKIYLGPIIIMFDINGRRKKMVFEDDCKY